MKIGVDYLSGAGQGGNVSYTKNLLAALSKIDNENTYFLYSFIHDFLPLRKQRLNFAAKNLKLFPAYLSSFGLSFFDPAVKLVNSELLKFLSVFNRLDVFHFTNPKNYVFGLKKSIVTVHDLAVLHDKHWAKLSSWDFYQKNIKKILADAKKIIAVSDFTKKDIMNFFNIPAEKIAVIHEAASADFYFEAATHYIKQKFNLDKFILYTGQLQPRKNIIRLLEAYSLLGVNIRNQFSLVLAGSSRSDYLQEIKDKIISLGLKNNVHILGWVDTTDLRRLYGAAKFFIYPSLLEGFGLPILEALNCNTPVITSNNSSLPEVAGEAALLIDPEDANSIKSAMEKLLLDTNVYNTLKLNCSLQAKKFSWQKAAEQTIKVYEEVNKLS